MFSRVYAWINERTGVSAVLDFFLERPIPKGVGWLHTLGSATLFLLILQVITGVALALYYVPTPDHAYMSVKYISENIPFGVLIRGMHRWGASLIVVLAFLHLLRVFFMGAYKYPRELNWVVGVSMFVLILAFGFTGYLLPWDQRAYWATVVGTHVAHFTPLIGDFMVQILRAGEQVGVRTLARFYNLHVFVLPALFGLLAMAHLFMVIKQGIAAPPKKGLEGLTPRELYQIELKEKQTQGRPFYEALLKDSIIALVLLAILIAMSLFLKIPMEKVADPTDVNYIPRPEWYFLFLFELLWFFKGAWIPVATFYIPLAILLVLVLLPFLDRRPVRHLSGRPLASALAFASLFAIGFLTYKGANAPLPPPAGGPIELSVSPGDITVPASALAGREVYEQLGCASCHAIKGRGAAAGPDLSKIGRKRDKEWLEKFIKEPTAINPKSAMPAYRELLGPELNALVEYMASLR